MRERNPNFVRNWLILLTILVIIYFGAKSYWSSLFSPVSSDTKSTAFVVDKGETTASIADRLEKEGLIRSSFAFKWQLRTEGNNHIEAGDFKLSPSMSVNEVIKTLSQGSLDKWVTLLEGWRVEEMADKLNKELGIDKQSYIKASKEGYMFPDTYLFNPKASIETTVSIQENTFDQKYTADLKGKIKALGLTPDEGVILASIVEREGRSDAVRQQIASILLKRLKIGMALNVDATLQYALGYSTDEKTWWRSTITKEDKAIDSPYNTYLNAGLPPGPICNPSLSSLTAVSQADPSSTPYLYYYVDSAGKIYYAKTREEHDQNVQNHP